MYISSARPGSSSPVAIRELIDVERKCSAASGRAHALEQQLIGLGLVPVCPRPG